MGRDLLNKVCGIMVKFYDTYPILSAVQRELQGCRGHILNQLFILNDDLKRNFTLSYAKKNTGAHAHLMKE